MLWGKQSRTGILDIHIEVESTPAGDYHWIQVTHWVSDSDKSGRYTSSSILERLFSISGEDINEALKWELHVDDINHPSPLRLELSTEYLVKFENLIATWRTKYDVGQ